MNNLAIIPARGGSKRIPLKNIKIFLGKPIISYSIEAALNSQLFDEIIVSTDNEDIAEISRHSGANVPFIRSAENSDDFATLSDVVFEVVNKYAEVGKNFENVCCILPTAPFITNQQLLDAFNKLKNESLDSVCSVFKFSYPVLRSLEFTKDNKLKMVWPKYLNTRSQDLKSVYHDTGLFYWVRTSEFLIEKTLFCKNGSAIILSELEVQDIDDETEWRIAELKYKLLHG
jgi:pseudaminic acid cytidylyltransferase